MSPLPNSKSDQLRFAISKLVGDNAHAQDTSPVWEPAFDVFGSSSEILVVIDLPEVDADEIVIDANSTSLNVRASRVFDHDCEDADGHARVGRLYGVFACSAPLPDNANAAALTSNYERGVLRVRVPRNVS
jgi:HSP20 family protein